MCMLSYIILSASPSTPALRRVPFLVFSCRSGFSHGQ